MANYATLKAAIQQVIKANGNNEITGPILQQSLLSMINSLGDGFMFAGIATPSTNPGTPDQNLYYIASTAGTYSNFNAIVVNANEVAILTYNGSWAKISTGFATSQALEKKVDATQSVNLFDKSSNLIVNNGYWRSDGFYSISYYWVTGPIKVYAGIQYKAPFKYADLGANHGIAIVDENNNFQGMFAGTVDGDYITFTPANDMMVSVNGGKLSKNTFMVCEAANYPNEYVAYQKVIGNEYLLAQKQLDQVNQQVNAGVDAKLGDYFTHQKSINLFNYYDPLIKKGGYYNYNANYTSSSGYWVTHPIALKAGVTYKAPMGSGLGTSAVIAKVDAQNNRLGKLTGTVADGFITYTPTEDLYASFNMGNASDKTKFMVCKASEYPETFVAFYDYEELNENIVVPGASGGNPLIGKSVIFTGDSICAGANDSYGGGYARRIGERNNMDWVNKAVGGGTIMDKNLIGSTFTICDTDFGSGADYIILEGGTNDADRIGSILNGNTPQYYGSYNLTDYVTAFDNATFCSAVERLLQRVISGFPTARVGFIIAMKMGVTSQGYTPETNNRRAYFETIIKICRKWGVPVLNLWDECTMNPRIASHYTSGQTYLYADGQHPTANGYDLMTPIIESWMRTL